MHLPCTSQNYLTSYKNKENHLVKNITCISLKNIHFKFKSSLHASWLCKWNRYISEGTHEKILKHIFMTNELNFDLQTVLSIYPKHEIISWVSQLVHSETEELTITWQIFERVQLPKTFRHFTLTGPNRWQASVYLSGVLSLLKKRAIIFLWRQPVCSYRSQKPELMNS